MTNTKRLGRYYKILSNNSNDDKSSSQSHFSELASLYRDNSRKQSFDWSKPLFGNKGASLQKVLASANKVIEKSSKTNLTQFCHSALVDMKSMGIYGTI
ncbi:MAG TPA: hypothetical protein VI278_10960 [Nitrososphaeraceae archaeon]